MSRSHQQSDELFLPPSAHPHRESFFDHPLSPTYMYDEETGTFKTIWPPTSAIPTETDTIDEAAYWEDVKPPSPLRTPPRKQVYQPPPIDIQHVQVKAHGYFDKELHFDTTVATQPTIEARRASPETQIAVPGLATVHLRSDLEGTAALPPPHRTTITLYDKPVNEYDDFDRGGLVADDVSEVSFSEDTPVSPNDDRTILSSNRETIQPKFETSTAKLWSTPRRDVAAEAPIVVHPEPSEVEYSHPYQANHLDDSDSRHHKPRILSDPGGGYNMAQAHSMYGRSADTSMAQGGVRQSYQRPPEPQYQQQQQQSPHPQRPQQDRQRIFSDPGTSQHWTLQQGYQREQDERQQRPRLFSEPAGGSHWERRRDMATGRSSVPPPISAYQENSSSSFKVHHVQRIPVGSLDFQVMRPNKEEGKKLSKWKRLKGYLS